MIVLIKEIGMRDFFEYGDVLCIESCDKKVTLLFKNGRRRRLPFNICTIKILEL